MLKLWQRNGHKTAWWKTAERANDTKMGKDQNCATDIKKCKYNGTCILILWFLPQYENQKILKFKSRDIMVWILF